MRNFSGFLKTISLLILLLCVGLPVSLFAHSANQPLTAKAMGLAQQNQQCGEIHIQAGRIAETDTPAQQVENCFWQAYQTCSPASLTLTIMGVDTVATHNFSLQGSAGQCVITDSVQFRVIPARTPTVNTYTCASLSQQGGGLTFSNCGDLGDIVIPAAAQAAQPASTEPASAVTLPGPFHVAGNQLIDASGKPIVLRGAQIDSAFNVANVDLNDKSSALAQATQHLTSETFTEMHQGWNMALLRLPVSNWLWQRDPHTYLDKLDSVIEQANSAGLVVVIALQSDAQSGSPYGKLTTHMPTAESVSFWKALAAHYTGNDNLLFDIFNEPSLKSSAQNDYTDADWQFWLHGGTREGQQFVGMQDVVDAIRSTGAGQIIIAEGMTGGTLKNISQNLIADPNVMYSVHMYFDPHNLTPQDWDAKFGFLVANYPLYVGEWAFLPNADHPADCTVISHDQAPQEVTGFLAYLDAHHISWTAASFTLNRLFLDYTTYTPTRLDIPWTCGDPTSTAGMGTLVKQYLTSQQP